MCTICRVSGRVSTTSSVTREHNLRPCWRTSRGSRTATAVRHTADWHSVVWYIACQPSVGPQIDPWSQSGLNVRGMTQVACEQVNKCTNLSVSGLDWYPSASLRAPSGPPMSGSVMVEFVKTGCPQRYCPTVVNKFYTLSVTDTVHSCTYSNELQTSRVTEPSEPTLRL